LKTYAQVVSLTDRQTIQEFAADLKEEIGDNLEEIKLFGSYATNEYVPGSDVDVLVLVENTEELDKKGVWTIAEEYSHREDVPFRPKVFEAQEFKRKLRQGYTFHTEVEDQGIEI
jgi:predicted nucleotidyltransferase